MYPSALGRFVDELALVLVDDGHHGVRVNDQHGWFPSVSQLSPASSA